MLSSELFNQLLIPRRKILPTLVGGAATVLLTNKANAQPRLSADENFDYQNPKDNLYAFGKIWAGYENPVIGCFHGLMYARIGNKRMIPVFGYEGTGILQCKYNDEGTLNIKSRETGYFTDLRTGNVLESWKNPFTEETVPVYHFYNNLLGGKLNTKIPKFAMGVESDTPTLMNEGTIFPDKNGEFPFILPFQTAGNDLMLGWDYTHEYTNPVNPEGWPLSSTGTKISPSEHFTFFIDRNDLENRDLSTVRFRAGFSRQCNWWPWMRMGQSKYKDGLLFGRMFSHKGLSGTQEIRPNILKYIEKNAPEYLELPKGWPIQRDRIGTWESYSQDIPPENTSYVWKEKRSQDVAAPPSGSGSL